MSTKCYHVCVLEKHQRKATRPCFHTVGPNAVELSKCVKQSCLYKKVDVYIYICSTCMYTKNNKVPHTHTMYHTDIYHFFYPHPFFALPQTSKTMGHWSVEDFLSKRSMMSTSTSKKGHKQWCWLLLWSVAWLKKSSWPTCGLVATC